jgi:translocator protein
MRLVLSIISAAPLVLGLGAPLIVSAIYGKQKQGDPCTAEEARKSKLQPPGWVFSVVWTLLYVLVGAAGALIWRGADARFSHTFAAWLALTLALAAWWPVFRLNCRPVGAFVSVVGIAALAVVTALLAWGSAARLGAALLVPLIAWLAFASLLAWQTIP